MRLTVVSFAPNILSECASRKYSSTCSLPDDGSPDEAVLDREHVRVLLRVGDRDVGELDVEVLVDRVEGAADGEVVLQLDHDVLADQGLEERVEEHNGGHEGQEKGSKNVDSS